MTARTLRVEFAPEYLDSDIPEDTQVHDVSLDASVVGIPEILENPHIDFPGVWRLVGETPSGAYRYEKIERIADTNDTVAG
jgi:hypothetical protein